MVTTGAPTRLESLRRGFRLGEWRVDPGTDRLTAEGVDVHLRPRVMDLIVFLASRDGAVATKGDLLDGVWSTRFVSESALSSAIAEARHGLGDDPASPRYLETIPKRGYRLLVSPSPLTPAPRAGREDAPRAAKAWPEGPDAVFVGREREMGTLAEALRGACSGRGSAVFVTGEAGSGKTALLAGFAERVLATWPEVAVAGGRCPLPVIPVEPFFPFREALQVLGGEPDWGWLPGVAKGLPVPGLAEWGRDLAEACAERAPALPGALLSPASAETGPGTAALLAQLESALRAFANRRPLLLLLDDLHWADRASVALLSRLGRSVPRSRILLLAAYRPEEALPAPGPHPPERAVDEVARGAGGATFVRLGQAPDRAFVDALVDAVPNTLGRDFRDALFARSEGQPLFTVEILRSLCAKGILAPGPDGRWSVAGTVDWDPIPDRVESLAREQVDSLDPFARRILAAAAIEGEEFCLETVAAALEEPLAEVLESVSTTLGRRRGLVVASRSRPAGGRRVALYRFRHALLRRWIHDGLDEAERRLGHERAAAAIREVFGELPDDADALLARPRPSVGRPLRAAPHLAARDRPRTPGAPVEALAARDAARRPGS